MSEFLTHAVLPPVETRCLDKLFLKDSMTRGKRVLETYLKYSCQNEVVLLSEGWLDQELFFLSRSHHSFALLMYTLLDVLPLLSTCMVLIVPMWEKNFQHI